jgi:hypothetical protein
LIEGKFDLARDQLATIEKICGSKDCEYYGELAKALTDAKALSAPGQNPSRGRRRRRPLAASGRPPERLPNNWRGCVFE